MLNAAQKRFLSIEQALIPAFFNCVINAWFVWYLFGEEPAIALMSGQPSVLVDVVATLFLLPAIVCLIVTPLAAGAARKKKELRTTKTRSDYLILTLLPANLWARSAFIGLFAVLFLTLPTMLGASLIDTTSININAYIAYKGFYTAVVAAIVGPIIAWGAVCDQSALLRAGKK